MIITYFVRSQLLWMGLWGVAHAGVFDVTARVGGQTAQASFETVDEALDSVTAAALNGLFGTGYTGVEAARLDVDFRGVAASMEYPTESSTLLVLDIPSIALREGFLGRTRDESQALLKQFLRANADILSRLQRQLVRSSPVDPVAGNPNSLMSRSVVQDFEFGLMSAEEARHGLLEDESGGEFGFTPTYTQMVAKSIDNPRSMDSGVLSLPLSYTYRFSTPGRMLGISLPIARADVDGAKAYDGGLAFCYRSPVTTRWYLAMTAGGRVSVSPDLGAGVWMGSGALTSSYLIPGENYSFTLGNMVGRYSVLQAKSRKKSFDPDIDNIVYRNGIMMEKSTGLAWRGKVLSMEYTFIDTRYTGTDLFNARQNEIGVSIGTQRKGHARASDSRAGLAYVDAPHARGIKLGFGYWF